MEDFDFRLGKPDPMEDELLAREIVNGFKANTDLGLKIIEQFEKIIADKRNNDTKSIPIENYENAVKALWGFIHNSRHIIMHGVHIAEIEKRRQDDWDILNKKMIENEMFKESWEELMILMKLEKS